MPARSAGLAPLLRRCPVLLALLVFAAPAQAQSPSQADAEVRALIARLGDSGCRFQRNGRWYGPAQAQAHLQRKHDWARRHGREGDTEAFIEQAASRSSLSGRAYRVACPGQAETDAGDWMRARVAELRAAAPPR